MIRMTAQANAHVFTAAKDIPRLSGFAKILGSVDEPPPRLAPVRVAAAPLPRLLDEHVDAPPEVKERTQREERRAANAHPRPRPKSFRQLAAENHATEDEAAGAGLTLFGWLGASIDSLGPLDTLDSDVLEPIDSGLTLPSAPSDMPDGLAEDLATLDVNISVEPLDAPPTSVAGPGTKPPSKDDGSVFEFPIQPAKTPKAPAGTADPKSPHRSPATAPVPADPIRDDGMVFEFPRSGVPRGTPVEPGTLGGGVPRTPPTGPRRGPASTSGTPTEGSSTSAEETSAFGAILGVAPSGPGAGAATAVVAQLTDDMTAADAPSEAEARAEAASLQQDARADVGNAITVRLDDALGHWEVDVIRRHDLLDLVLRGDTGLHAAVRDSTPELRHRLAQDGLTLNRVSLENTISKPANTQTTERSSAMQHHSSSNSDARREEAPPWPRSVSGRVPTTVVPNLASPDFVRRGVLDRAV